MGVVPYRRMPMRASPVGRVGRCARASRRVMAWCCARRDMPTRHRPGVLRQAVGTSRRGRAVMRSSAAWRRGSPPDRRRPSCRVPAAGGRRPFDEPDRGDGDHQDDGDSRRERGPPHPQAGVGQSGTSRPEPPCPGPGGVARSHLAHIERGAPDGRVNRARALAPEVIRCRWRCGGVRVTCVRVNLLRRACARADRDEVLQRPDPVPREADNVLRSVFALAFHGHRSNPFSRILQSLSQLHRHQYVSRGE
jgi:hypothetical protein